MLPDSDIDLLEEFDLGAAQELTFLCWTHCSRWRGIRLQYSMRWDPAPIFDEMLCHVNHMISNIVDTVSNPEACDVQAHLHSVLPRATKLMDEVADVMHDVGYDGFERLRTLDGVMAPMLRFQTFHMMMMHAEHNDDTFSTVMHNMQRGIAQHVTSGHGPQMESARELSLARAQVAAENNFAQVAASHNKFAQSLGCDVGDCTHVSCMMRSLEPDAAEPDRRTTQATPTVSAAAAVAGTSTSPTLLHKQLGETDNAELLMDEEWQVDVEVDTEGQQRWIDNAREKQIAERKKLIREESEQELIREESEQNKSQPAAKQKQSKKQKKKGNDLKKKKGNVTKEQKQKQKQEQEAEATRQAAKREGALALAAEEKRLRDAEYERQLELEQLKFRDAEMKRQQEAGKAATSVEGAKHRHAPSRPLTMGGGAAGGSWNCSACTFLNSQAAGACSVCATARAHKMEGADSCASNCLTGQSHLHEKGLVIPQKAVTLAKQKPTSDAKIQTSKSAKPRRSKSKEVTQPAQGAASEAMKHVALQGKQRHASTLNGSQSPRV